MREDLTVLQEAWRTLIATAPSSELQQALTSQLLDGFFELASTPATQSLEDSLMFRADPNDQVADELMLCCPFLALAVCGLYIYFRV